MMVHIKYYRRGASEHYNTCTSESSDDLGTTLLH